MKKTLSIILIITMLLTMAVAAVPAGAAGITEPSDKAITGNGVITEDNRAAYKAELVRQGYIPLVNSKTAGDGKPDNAVKPGNNTIKADTKYYMYEDINWGDAHYAAAPANIVIDGCGHTINMTANYMIKNTNGITLKNLTVKRDAAIGNGNMCSIVGGNNSQGATVVENVTLDIKVKAKSYSQGVLTGFLAAGSTINNVRCKVEINATDSDQTLNRIGALVGGSVANGVKISNVVTEGVINITAARGLSSKGIGGIVGQATEPVTFENCFNKVNITVNSGAAFDVEVPIGGIIGKANKEITFKNCVNSGNITVKETEATASDSMISTIGGIVGEASKVRIENCVNTGDITGDNNIGGILGRVISSDQGEPSGVADIEKCLNEGAITCRGSVAAGIVGMAYKTYEDVIVSINDSLNVGKITAGSNASGIFGVAEIGYPSIYIDGCINCGDISAEEDSCSGIYGQSYGDDDDPCDPDTAITNSINLGKLYSSEEGTSEKAPIGYVDKIENAYYYIGCIDEGATSTNGTPITEFEQAHAKAIELNGMAFSFESLEAAMEKAEPYLENPEKYVADTIRNLQAVYDEAKSIIDSGLYTVNATGVVFTQQNTIDAQAEAMLEAIEGTYLKTEMATALKEAIADAEAFMDQNTNMYKTAPWNEFTSALKAARSLCDQGNIYDMDYAVIYPVTNGLKAALNALEKDDATLGGDILSAADFALLENQKGEFTLRNDITVSAPVKNFAGTLNGNGYTITLDGCALFEDADGITVTNLTIVGNAGEAKSIFGKAKGEVRMANLYIDVEGKLEAAIFDEADANADVAISTVMSITDASVAALVAGDCQIAIEKALVMAAAPALVTAEDAQVRVSYVDGVVYYNAEGEASNEADILASGEVTYVMNEALGLEDYLVQRIGKDALPKVAVALIDGSNCVRFEDGKYVNLGQNFEFEVDTTPKPIPPVALIYSALQKAIARAEAHTASDYTAESFKVLADALVAAKALEADTQDDIDAAVDAINLAIADLDLKPADVVSVDYSKLTEAIAKAEALKVNDYTSESWTALQIALSNAKKAKLATAQTDVDAAIAALNGAVANLVKAPVESDAPVADDKDDNTTDNSGATEEEGCGSVIGGAAVILTAVLALGAGVSFKKRED